MPPQHYGNPRCRDVALPRLTAAARKLCAEHGASNPYPGRRDSQTGDAAVPSLYDRDSRKGIGRLGALYRYTPNKLGRILW
jgi:hypothetical protein